MVYSKVTSKTRGWTPERRARQAEAIRSWQPWNRSTGPRTDAGKATASQNRQKSLERASDAVEQARRDLMEARRKLERMKGAICLKTLI